MTNSQKPTKHLAYYDVQKWLDEIKNRGIITFDSEQLRQIGLNNPPFICFARARGLIKRGQRKLIYRDGIKDANHCVRLHDWTITDTYRSRGFKAGKNQTFIPGY